MGDLDVNTYNYSGKHDKPTYLKQRKTKIIRSSVENTVHVHELGKHRRAKHPEHEAQEWKQTLLFSNGCIASLQVIN